MSAKERAKYVIQRDEEVNMHWYPEGADEHPHSCGAPEIFISVGWAQNGTLRFFCKRVYGDYYGAWGSRAWDYAYYLKKHRLTLLESYNYNPFEFLELAHKHIFRDAAEIERMRREGVALSE